ncbi:MAG: hypothetical protein Fur009_4110 [Candidatus Microgenomates bacterium]
MSDKKILIFTVFFVFLLLLIYIILTFKPKNPSQSNQTSIIPTQKIKINEKNQLTNPTIAPTIPPQNFTGVKEEELPKSIKDYSDQKIDLMKKLPFKTTYFTIDFDYVEDKFTLTYTESVSISKQMFFSWLSQNYPALSLKDFLEK